MSIRIRASVVAAAVAGPLLLAGSAQAAMAPASATHVAPTSTSIFVPVKNGVLEPTKAGIIEVVKVPQGTITVTLEKIGAETPNAAAAPAFTPRPATAVNCVSDYTVLGGVKHGTCFGIYGSGAYVSYMDTTASNSTGYQIKMSADIQTNSGLVIGTTGWVEVASGYQIEEKMTFETDIQNTTYCGGGWGNDGYNQFVCEPITD